MNRISAKTLLGASLLTTILAAPLEPAWAQGKSIELAPLAGVAPPLPDLSGIVVDKKAAIALGKALFWDKDAGSDGQACASCHYHAGADMRTTNQLNPGQRGNDVAFGDANGLTGSGARSGPNYTLKPADFPMHKLADIDRRDSAVLFDSSDVVGSSGSFGEAFGRVAPRAFTLLKPTNPKTTTDKCKTSVDPIFHTAFGNTRKTTPRNTPSVINAVYNFRNFWDGRANNIFNGVDPFGPRDPDAEVFVRKTATTIATQKLALVDASLASQATGPLLSDAEMSCAGRTFADVGKKLLLQVPLGTQAVASTDSVLAAYRAATGKGLTGKYFNLVQKAFDPKYWNTTGFWKIAANGPVATGLGNGYAQIELNFSMFWGLSIMLYESTLISDQSPYDDYLTKRDTSRFGQLEQDGMQVFQGKGQCVACHRGPALTSAALTLALPRHILEELEEPPEDKLIERMAMNDHGQPAMYDNGFYNIGVRPVEEDVGLGGTDPWGNPLSYTRQFKKNPAAPGPDKFKVDTCDFEIPTGELMCGADLGYADLGQERVAVDGTFKVPSLRNIAQTPPYFHNGGQATLRQVVDFYSRGGDRRSLDTPEERYKSEPALARNDTTGTGPLGETIGPDGKRGSNLAADIEPLALIDYEKDALVAFLQSLTDDRVRCHKAPFDHPELPMSIGALNADANRDGRADELTKTLIATGTAGIPSCAVSNSGDLFAVSSSLFGQAFK